MASTVFSSLKPSWRRERKTSGAGTDASKLSARFGDVTISAPTAGAWHGYERTRSIESYNTMPSLDRLLQPRIVPSDPATSTGTQAAMSNPAMSMLPTQKAPRSLAKRRITPPYHSKHDPSSSSASGPQTKSTHSSPASSPRGHLPRHIKPLTTYNEPSIVVHAENLGDLVVSPRFFSPEWQEQQLLEHQFRFQHSQTSPQAPCLDRRQRSGSSPTSYQSTCPARAASVGPQDRRPLQSQTITVPLIYKPSESSPRSITAANSDDDADTIFDSDEDDLRSIHSDDSGFIFDKIDVGIVTPSSSIAGSPGIEALGISQGAYVGGFGERRKAKRAVGSYPSTASIHRNSSGSIQEREELRNAVQDAENRRLEAEKETECVKRLLAAVQAKKDNKARKKLGINLWSIKDKDKDKRREELDRQPTLLPPVKELVPDAEDIWG